MSVLVLENGTVSLEGDCSIEDAETLLQHLLDDLDAPVDLRRCSSAHTAVIQVLMASGRGVLGPPEGEFLAKFIAPTLPR